MTICELLETYKLEVISGESGLTNKINIPQVSRPGLELAGLFDFYEFNRIQVLGSKEVTFFWWLSEDDQKIRTKMLFDNKPPAFVFSVNAEVPKIFIDFGNEYNIPVLKSSKRTSELIASLYLTLNSKLAERSSIHGTLVDINGVGVLIRGQSGVGKSEVALELVRRGHQLVADDRVDIFQRELGEVVGEAPEIIRKYLEIRGIGLVNVVDLFGVRAFKEMKTIMLVVDLKEWDDDIEYDRLGIESQTIRFFDTNITHIELPVTSGRNIASLVEFAAMNAQLRHLGTNSAKDFADRLEEKLKNSEGDE
jgi:HPr kinase/phosphorylase